MIAQEEDDRLPVAELLRRLRLADLLDSRDGGASEDRLSVLVVRIEGVQVEIHPKDHNPPHFHVKVLPDEGAATYRIDTLGRLSGSIPRHLERVALTWAAEQRDSLQTLWDSLRPTAMAAR